MAKTRTGGQIVVDELRAFGVRHIFGVPGGQTLAITDALIDQDDIEFVTMRHEGAAACAADAVGRLTGRPGVCLATTGPGATNLLTGVGGAFRDSSPMLVLTCNNNLRDLGRDDAQAADHIDIFRTLVKRAIYVGDAGTIQQALQEAYLVATSGCPGPVLVDFARNAVEASVDTSSLVASGLGSLAEPMRAPAPADRVTAAAELLATSCAPVIWLGNGTIRSGGAEVALELAQRIDAPVITTFTALGAVPSSHPLAFGPRSRMGTGLSATVLEGADLLLAVGNSLNAISTSRWSLPLPERIIQVDADSDKLGRYYAPRTLGLLGDARTVLGQLLHAVPSTSGQAASSARQVRLERLVAERERWRYRLMGTASPPGAVAPDRLVYEVREATPDDTILVVDAGNPGVWTHLWDVRAGGEYLKPVGFGNMGFALPAAIAASQVRPGVPVVVLIGDGSLAMTMAELETVARSGISPCASSS